MIVSLYYCCNFIIAPGQPDHVLYWKVFCILKFTFQFQEISRIPNTITNLHSRHGADPAPAGAGHLLRLLRLDSSGHPRVSAGLSENVPDFDRVELMSSLLFSMPLWIKISAANRFIGEVQGDRCYFFQRRILLWGFFHTSWYFFPSLD